MFGGHSRGENYYSEQVQSLEKLTRRLHRSIQDGSFYRMPFRDRKRLIRRVKRTYSSLTGPKIDHVHKTALTAAAFALSVATVGATQETSTGTVPRFKSPFELISQVELDAYARGKYEVIGSVDIDNDGDVDIVSASESSAAIYVYPNAGIKGERFSAGYGAVIPIFYPVAKIEFSGAEEDGFRSLNMATGDLDGDGDIDVIRSKYGEGDILYYENVGNAYLPVFTDAKQGPFEQINSSLHFLSLSIVDLDGDGDMDIVSTAYYPGNNDVPEANIYYIENSGSIYNPIFSTSNSRHRVISDLVVGTFVSHSMGDFDGDLDMDIVVSVGCCGKDNNDIIYGLGNNYSAYLENIGSISDPIYSIAQISSEGIQDSNSTDDGVFPQYVRLLSSSAEDIDNDGDIDLIQKSPVDALFPPFMYHYGRASIDYFENTQINESPPRTQLGQ